VRSILFSYPIYRPNYEKSIELSKHLFVLELVLVFKGPKDWKIVVGKKRENVLIFSSQISP
jgi:hypothetical protein